MKTEMADNDIEVIEEVQTPTIPFARCKKLDFQILSGVATDESKGWEWFTFGIDVPVTVSDERLPFRLTSSTFQWPKSIGIIIAKKVKEPTLIMRVSNFGSFPQLLSKGTLHAKVQGSFSGYVFDHKTESIMITDSELPDEAEVFINDDFVRKFNHKALGYNGHFLVEIHWKLSLTQQGKSNFLKNLPRLTSQEFQNIEGTVNLLANNGKAIKFSKGLLAVSSSKFKAQFEHDSGKDVTVYQGDGNVISEQGLLAFIEFVCSSSLKRALESCSVALDLLMTAHYHMVLEMETMLQNLLLIQPGEWFDLETSFRLFVYASELASIIDDEEKTVWVNLKWKALRNMQGVKNGDLKKLKDLQDWISQPLPLEMLQMLISLA